MACFAMTGVGCSFGLTDFSHFEAVHETSCFCFGFGLVVLGHFQATFETTGFSFSFEPVVFSHFKDVYEMFWLKLLKSACIQCVVQLQSVGVI